MELSLNQASAGAGPAPIKDGSTATFMADVIEASREVPVIVDFWAPWCGPCKQLGPRLEKAVGEARGAVRLVKINIDENPELAQQLRIQSIPAVYAFFGGRPVDGFAGALSDGQVKQFVDRLIQAAGAERPASPIDDALAQAKELTEAGDHATASAIYSQVLAHEAGNRAAIAGLARCHLAKNDAAAARALLDPLDDEAKADPEIAAALSALSLADKGAKAGDTAALEAAVAADPTNHQARYDLALALYGGGRKEEAIDHLVEIVRRARQWNDEAARKQLLEFFEAQGPTDPLTVAGRRKLSSVLFS